MACCIPTQYGFTNQAITNIPYDSVLVAKYGTHPKVNVLYLDPVTGEYYYAPFFTSVHFTGSAVVVDHGGINSGLITLT